MPLNQMAVLIRAGYHSFDLEIELVRAGIPFMKFGGFKFMESAHIKDILSYLRVVANPRDTLSWNRLLLLVPGVGRHLQQVQRPGAGRTSPRRRRDHLAPQPSARPDSRTWPTSWKVLNAPGQTLMTRMNQALAYLRTPGQGPL